MHIELPVTNPHPGSFAWLGGPRPQATSHQLVPPQHCRHFSPALLRAPFISSAEIATKFLPECRGLLLSSLLLSQHFYNSDAHILSCIPHLSHEAPNTFFLLSTNFTLQVACQIVSLISPASSLLSPQSLIFHSESTDAVQSTGLY